MIDYEIRRGGLTSDPELRFTPSGTPVCSFSLAQSSRRYNEDARDWETVRAQYVDVVVWNIRRGETVIPLAEIAAENLRKGSRVAVHGFLSTRTWQDRDGNNRSRLEFIADGIYLDVLSTDERGSWGRGEPGGGQPSPPPSAPVGSSDEPPF